MTGQSAKISAIYRYPVKGLSAQKLERVQLEPGRAIAWDRAFAIENGGREFDPENPMFMPKTKFFMLQRDARLAALESDFDERECVLTVRRNGKQVARGNLGQPVGRQLIEQFFAAYMAEEARGAPRIVHAPGHTISDCGAHVVSIINLATLRDIERVVGMAVDPVRFRGNIYVDGLEPWAEFDWVEKEIRAGREALLFVESRIQRCAATNVNPATAARDMNIPRILEQAFGHTDCGVYAAVRGAGGIAASDRLAPA